MSSQLTQFQAHKLFEISCWQDVMLIFSKGHSSGMGDNVKERNKCVYCYTPGKRRVGRMEKCFLILFFSWLEQPKCIFLALNMCRPHTFCVYIGLRKLKLLFTCEIFAFYLFFVPSLICFGKFEEKVYSRVGGDRENRSGYRKHNYFFFA